ncbi:probable carbohydrate esterase At4g34215 [Solanum stenotomum]|uniref:probable carbohydrate esterase At4g34215 n=1 Tax=Solanum stenotomum TaxID=172797 RepID=UPI0020D021E0|nr:probable carbohydrate esterase At4g34215 [Solanum stenotomum]
MNYTIFETKDEKQIFILAGQSNMAGRGGVVKRVWDGYVPPECHRNPAIHRLNGNSIWEVAQEPLHEDIDFNKTCGIGPTMVFANIVLEMDPQFGKIGLIPCAIGGTSIDKWSQGSRLYNDMIKRARIALQDGGTIQGILWYQGERDALTLKKAKSYKRKLEKLYGDVRNDLNSPLLPIFQVALASGEGPFMAEVREAQLGINLDNVITVDALGLPLEQDALHLTTQAQVQLGYKLADAFLKAQ